MGDEGKIVVVKGKSCSVSANAKVIIITEEMKKRLSKRDDMKWKL